MTSSIASSRRSIVSSRQSFGSSTAGRPVELHAAAGTAVAGGLGVTLGVATGSVRALIVAERSNVGEEVAKLIDWLGFEIVHATPGHGPTGGAGLCLLGQRLFRDALNFGDRFAYDVTRKHGCLLFFVGDEFERLEPAQLRARRPDQNDADRCRTKWRPPWKHLAESETSCSRPSSSI